MPLFESVYDLTNGLAALRHRRHGVIEIRDGRLQAIQLRPFPTFVTQLRVWRDRQNREARQPQDVCYLHYDQLRSLPNFLVLKYVISKPGTSYRSFRMAMIVLDEIARIKRTDAIVCELSNSKLSDRLATRWGWERHVPSSRKRHFIKRFYGDYPSTSMTPRCEFVTPQKPSETALQACEEMAGQSV